MCGEVKIQPEDFGTSTAHKLRRVETPFPLDAIPEKGRREKAIDLFVIERTGVQANAAEAMKPHDDPSLRG